MRTKTLLIAAAISLAGVGASLAQSVYSVNAVGYVNLSLPIGASLIANPLNGTNNLLNTILPNGPVDATLYKFDAVNQRFFDAETYFDNFGWFPGTTSLSPGEGAFIILTGPATLTFVGDVPQGNLSNPVPANYSLRSSQVPQAGHLTADLGYPGQVDDVVYQWDRVNQKYLDANTYFDNFGWFPNDPNLTVGESFFISSTAGVNWTRTFSVN